MHNIQTFILGLMVIIATAACAARSTADSTPVVSQATTAKPQTQQPPAEEKQPIAPPNKDEPEEKNETVPSEPEAPPIDTLRFPWCPSTKVTDAYEMADPADQHRIVFTKGVKKGGTYPVVVAFHGQPKRGKNPRDYFFMKPVEELITQMVANNEIEPVILVMPVFRFTGGNWPWFNPKKFKDEIKTQLQGMQIEDSKWFAFGHSGAAGCGGGGLNQAHLMKPDGIGFFDTCLGTGWANEIAQLEKSEIKTVNIHSVETAGYKPRQRPEYQSTFDFGKAYKPVGMKPAKCPPVTPGNKLRKNHGTGCYANKSGNVLGFIVDSGEGKAAHKNILEPAIRYFLTVFAQLGLTND